MSMTREEKYAKGLLLNLLKQEDYHRYAQLLKEFDLNLTTRPDVVAFMEPAKGRIVVNRGLSMDQISVVVRHEILHFYLQHELRMLKALAKNAGLDFNKLDDVKIGELKNKLYGSKTFNIAADFEISNIGYTPADKAIVRRLKLNDEVVGGLVTEDQYPDWQDWTVDQMYNELIKLEKEEDNTPVDEDHVYGEFIDPTTFVDANGVAYGI